MDRARWRKLIGMIDDYDGVVGECFFWYRLTRVFPDKFHRAVKRLCCVCVCSSVIFHICGTSHGFSASAKLLLFLVSEVILGAENRISLTNSIMFCQENLLCYVSLLSDMMQKLLQR